MPITTSPIVLKDSTLELLADAASAYTEYRCQLSQMELQPSESSGGSEELETFCDTHSSGAGGVTWALVLAGFQAYDDANDLTNLLFDEAKAGRNLAYRITPKGGVPSATNRGYFGDVVAFPTNVGGTAKKFAVFTVTLKCTGWPEKQETAWPADLAAMRREAVDL